MKISHTYIKAGSSLFIPNRHYSSPLFFLWISFHIGPKSTTHITSFLKRPCWFWERISKINIIQLFPPSAFFYWRASLDWARFFVSSIVWTQLVRLSIANGGCANNENGREQGGKVDGGGGNKHVIMRSLTDNVSAQLTQLAYDISPSFFRTEHRHWLWSRDLWSPSQSALFCYHLKPLVEKTWWALDILPTMATKSWVRLSILSPLLLTFLFQCWLPKRAKRRVARESLLLENVCQTSCPIDKGIKKVTYCVSDKRWPAKKGPGQEWHKSGPWNWKGHTDECYLTHEPGLFDITQLIFFFLVLLLHRSSYFYSIQMATSSTKTKNPIQSILPSARCRPLSTSKSLYWWWTRIRFTVPPSLAPRLIGCEEQAPFHRVAWLFSESYTFYRPSRKCR